MNLCEFSALLAFATAMSFTPGPNTLVGLGVGAWRWMAWQLARRDEKAATPGSRLKVTFRQGVGLRFVNPKAWLMARVVNALLRL